MTAERQKGDLGAKGIEHVGEAGAQLRRAAIGFESEFNVVVDERPAKPEDVFGDPRAFIRGDLMHRKGTSYHLPTGAAVYFDTGVIELATPMIEIEPGCAARAGRSLWEAIRFVREELDDWERRTGRAVRLVGFSTHYNVSFELDAARRGTRRTVEKLAWVLAHVLPAPVMLLVANRKSTGIGVRPRGNRIEITADFTPNPRLMIAAGTLITGIVRDVMAWESYDLAALEARRLPVIVGFAPMPHTTRKGWLARYDCYPLNPFVEDVDAPLWDVHDGSGESLRLSLRQVAGRIARAFRPSIGRLADRDSYRLIRSVMRGRGESLLDLAERPPSYEDVGRLCSWQELFTERRLRRSNYERVLLRAIARESLRLEDDVYVPKGMRGWSHVVFERDRDGTRHAFSIDYLLDKLHVWERR